MDEMTHEGHERRGHIDECCVHCMEPQMSSFAAMAKMMDPEIFKRLKWPPDWFPKTYKRRDQASLNALEHERFLCAFETLNNNGTLGGLVAIHGDMSHYQHGSQRFLPWHRIFLILLERALRSVHPEVTIPYWDWTQASEDSIPSWLVSYTPTVKMPTPTPSITVTRAPGAPSSLTTLASNTPSVMADSTFASFTGGLEGIHNGVHVWVGGTMGWISTAPADPIFWLHHCNIDRLWWQWQETHAGLNPNLTGTGPSSPVMDPWAYTEADTRSITSLGYTYA